MTFTIDQLEKGHTYYNEVSGPGYTFTVLRNAAHTQWLRTRAIGPDAVQRCKDLGRDPEDRKMYKNSMRNQRFVEVE